MDVDADHSPGSVGKTSDNVVSRSPTQVISFMTSLLAGQEAVAALIVAIRRPVGSWAGEIVRGHAAVRHEIEMILSQLTRDRPQPRIRGRHPSRRLSPSRRNAGPWPSRTPFQKLDYHLLVGGGNVGVLLVGGCLTTIGTDPLVAVNSCLKARIAPKTIVPQHDAVGAQGTDNPSDDVWP